MSLRDLRPGPEWGEAVGRLPLHLQDVHWLPGLSAAHELQGHEAHLLVLDKLELDAYIVQPLLVCEDGCARSPYNFGGPVGVSSSVGVHVFYEELLRWLGERGLREQCTLNPLLAQAQVQLVPWPTRVVSYKRAYVMKLGSLRELRQTTRHAARKAQEENGVRVVADEGPSSANLQIFEDMYQLSMEQKNAAKHWRYPAGYFHRLCDGLRGRAVLLFATVRGQVECGCLVLHGFGRAYYHYAARRGAYPSLGAGQLLVLQAARWVEARGSSVLHLGGGVQAGDSLERFKAGFTKHSLPVHIYAREAERASAAA